MRDKSNIAAWGRWGLVGAIGGIACALLVTLWMLYAGVQDASSALIRGNSVGFQAKLRSDFSDFQERPDKEDLEYILDEHAEAGLRYLAVFYENGEILSVGHSHLAGPKPQKQKRRLKAGVPLVQDGRVLVLSRVRITRPKTRARPRARARARSKRPPLLFEFEPLESNSLSSSSIRSLTIGAGASALLLVLAILLFRHFLRWDRLAQKAEHDRRLQSLGQMSAVMAHEIRNPLASLKGNAQVLQLLLAKDPDNTTQDSIKKRSEKLRAKSDRVVSESVRLETLVNDLLEFAKTGTISPTSCDPAAFLRESVARITSSGIESNLECHSEGAPPLWSFDSARMHQVMENLLRNAAAAGNTVTASVSGDSDALVFVVSDNGSGIDGDPDKIFEPFFSNRSHGTGLGLAIAKRLVELHQGTISARKREGGGAEFIVTLPKLKS
ncbi:MAG: HAMP domain-containing histidine kinase [Kofleriaceae bacterium]|nr:HAMP domain-containing histidine kinase [Kofleriaceae bacterium]